MSVPVGTPGLSDKDRDSLAEFFRRGGTFCASLPSGSGVAYLAGALCREFGRTWLWITDGPNSLDALARDLAALHASGGPEWVVLAPREAGAEAKPSRGSEVTGDRLDALRRLASDAPPAIVLTAIQSLQQSTALPDAMRQLTRTLRSGAEIPLDDLLAFLADQGYEFQAEVLAVGQAAHRGGIVDVWPPTEDWPIRIEFFGDTIESLRSFDPSEQRSRAAMESAILPPAAEPRAEGSLLDYLPSDTVCCRVEPDQLDRHAELYRQVAAQTPGLTLLEPDLERFKHRLDFSLAESESSHRFDLSPLDAPAPETGSRLDAVESLRRGFVTGLVRRAESGWTVRVCFATPGARERFTESYPDAAARLDLREGVLSEGLAYPPLRWMAVSENDLFGRSRDTAPRPARGSRRAADATERVAEWSDLQPGDLVVHVDHGIGKYLGLFQITVGGAMQEVLSIEYAGGGKLHVPVAQSHLLSRYVGVGKHKPDLHALGGKRWAKDKISAERSVQDLAAALLETQARRDALPGHAFRKDTPWQHEFEASFPFQETPDQAQAIADVKADMESPRPMDRLVCGDVGYGKTEVALRAAFKAVCDGKQVALLAPTTVLAQQHYDTFSRRLAAWPFRVEMLSRFQTPAEQRDIVARLGRGEVDVVIGTHRLVQPDVQFKDLGLVILDEEQRFGVKQKEHLKHMRNLVDVLTLTATPIPRTLYLSLTGARDLSTIQTPPVERLPIETIVAENTDEVVRRAVLNEINREGQVFYLYNRVQSIENAWQRLRSLVPEARIEIAHGQMPEKQLAFIMRAFVRGEFDVLLCTTIIESGLDIPNVNTIVIERADRFGMAELYQLRGRVGRYKRKAYAYLLLPRHGHLFDTARKRIGAIRRYSSLGSGFKLAMRDLELRGAGNILGSEQSGHIAAVGFDLYCQLLKRTVAQLKGEKPPPLIDVDVQLDFLAGAPDQPDAPGAAVLPAGFIADESHRIALYRRIAGASTQADVDALRDELRDRFGKLPSAVGLLLDVARLRIDAAARGIRKVQVEDGKVMLTRRGELLAPGGRFPRLTAKRPADRLDELRRLVKSVR